MQDGILGNGEFSAEVLEFARHIAGQSKVVAVAQVDDFGKSNGEKTIREVMVVIHDFQPRMISYIKAVKNKAVLVFAVDQWIFERDVDRGFLGEAIASKLVFPYHALQGAAYLRSREVELKRRLVVESLENLVINFPELANTIQIQPQYFLYEVFSSRLKAFPLLAYDISDLYSNIEQNEAGALEVYYLALTQLQAEGKIVQQNGYISITPKFVAQCQDPKIRLLNLSKQMPRTLFTSVFGVLPQLMNVVSQNTLTFLRTQKINLLHQPGSYSHLVDAQKYVFFPTAEGLVSLSDKIDIKGFAKRLLLKDQNVNVEVEPVGGMLNDVYLIRAGDRKVLAKRFKDWSGFKWFPLTLWSFGARSFSVAGQARLAKECAISELLRAGGFNVPKILHVSNAQRIIFMEFIEGESLSLAIKRYSTDDAGVEVLDTVKKVGETMAKAHRYGITLGDTKPDNVLVKDGGEIYLIDFEQAQQGGDRAWDIAVFLYYCGHYLQPFDSSSNGKAGFITGAFIEGYLLGGGDVGDVRKAALPKYTRVFSVFTMPAIMAATVDVCKKAEKQK